MHTETKSQVERKKQIHFSPNFQQSKSALILNTLVASSSWTTFVFKRRSGNKATLEILKMKDPIFRWFWQFTKCCVVSIREAKPCAFVTATRKITVSRFALARSQPWWQGAQSTLGVFSRSKQIKSAYVCLKWFYTHKECPKATLYPC